MYMFSVLYFLEKKLLFVFDKTKSVYVLYIYIYIYIFKYYHGEGHWILLNIKGK